MKSQTVILCGALLLAGLGLACQQPSAALSSPASTPAATAPSVAPVATPAAPENDEHRISVADAKAAVAKGEAVVIDVRGVDAYKIAHIKGAIEHNIGRLESNDYKGLPKNKLIIAYCSCPAEQTSLRAVTLLEQGGFKNAKALVGGNAAWEAAGGEMVKAPPTSNP